VNTPSQSNNLTLPLAFASFILLGLAAGLLGVAWPAIRAEFELPLEAAGTLLGASTVGYLAASFTSGPFAFRMGSGRMYALGGGLMVLGMGTFVAGSSWAVIIAAALMSGVGSGLIDAGLNAYVAAHHSPRAMNWLHAFFGIGVTIMPLVEAEALKANAWRNGYALVALVALAAAVAFALTRNDWRAPAAVTATSKRGTSVMATLRLPAVWLGILLLFLYAGVEAVPGQWGYSLFTEARGMETNAAGFWVSVYWGSFTIGRMFFGTYMPKVSVLTLVRSCMAAAGVGALLLWWNPAMAVGLAGLVLLGFAQAPLFPVLISETPKYLGGLHSQNAIGFQVAGAGVGIAALPGLAGLLAAGLGLEIVGPFIVVSLVLLFIVHELRVSYGAVRPGLRQSVSTGD
jgi:fucose permease